ncbi:hypothetical protein ACIHCQ_22770 [Streptomyces sp. NPDC052236]|uniref:hypothetical protein n=1 Tax=Streptomyces sp. NPDC052236 TaxID=3365686 RepID=UPI0037D571AE
MTIRNIIGSVLALIGATAAVWSPFRGWYDGRRGRYYRVEDLFNGITATRSDLAASILLPLAFAALVTLIGLVLRSRPLVALAGLVVLGFTVLWMVRQGQEAGSLVVGGDGSGLGDGVALAVGGGVLLLVASVVMSGRRRREALEEPPGYGPTGYGAPGYGPPEYGPAGHEPPEHGPGPDRWDESPPGRS